MSNMIMIDQKLLDKIRDYLVSTHDSGYRDDPHKSDKLIDLTKEVDDALKNASQSVRVWELPILPWKTSWIPPENHRHVLMCFAGGKKEVGFYDPPSGKWYTVATTDEPRVLDELPVSWHDGQTIFGRHVFTQGFGESGEQKSSDS